MSPILKRDVGEQLRQARRLALAATGHPLDPEPDAPYHHHQHHQGAYLGFGDAEAGDGYATGSSPRQGIGVDAEEVRRDESVLHAHANGWSGNGKGKGKAKCSDEDLGRAGRQAVLGHEEDRMRGEDMEGEDEDGGMEVEEEEGVGLMNGLGGGGGGGGTAMGKMGYEDPLAHHPGQSSLGALRDLRNLLLESTPSLLLSLVGLVFTGELLEHLARWRVFLRVDELFILVPMIGNLKGNLEMCLSARLGTSANIGELDHRHTRRALLAANMTLLGLQALLISCLAAVLSFVLGLVTVHRLGDQPVRLPGAEDPGLAVGEQEWHEGYTRPGWKQLVMVLATGMGAAGLSSAVLGSFMSSLIVLSRWMGVDPDNVTPPIAACLGDLLTLFILALLGTLLVGTMDSPVPLLAVILMSVAAGWFTRRVMRNPWVKKVAKGGWIPLIGAMLISSGTGMVLEKGVGKYRGFALLAISMTGLTGSIGAIHANRLSTALHQALHPHPPHHRGGVTVGLSAKQRMAVLFALAFPIQGCFVAFVRWAGWIDLSLGWAGWVSYAMTTAISLAMAHAFTLFFWSKDLDPDSYTLPIHSALVDFLGQLLLMLAYEVCILQGVDVQVHDPPA